MSKRFVSEFRELLRKQSAKESLFNHFKIKVDSEILCLANDLKKIVWGYEKEFTPNIPFELMELSAEEISKQLNSRKILGFQVIKSVSKYIYKLENITQNPIFSNKIDEEIIAAIVRLISILHLYETNIKQRSFFVSSDEESRLYKLVDGHKLNPDNPKGSFILLKKMDGGKGKVIDSGTIPKYNISKALIYLELDQELKEIYFLLIKDIIGGIDQALERMGNKILIDPATFKMN